MPGRPPPSFRLVTSLVAGGILLAGIAAVVGPGHDGGAAQVVLDHRVIVPNLAADSANAPTSTPTATPTTGTCASATGDIVALDKAGETVTVNAQGLMTGWYIVSESGNQRFDFPDGYVGNGNVTIYSGTPQFTNSQSMLWWSGSNLWNNGSDDDATLFDCNDTQRDFFEDGM